MPDIDGLKMCKMLRQKPQFKELPIVMLTAKDRLIDKMKGKYVGADYYLTKPFEPEKLKEVIHSLLQESQYSSVS